MRASTAFAIADEISKLGMCRIDVRTFADDLGSRARIRLTRADMRITHYVSDVDEPKPTAEALWERLVRR